MLGRMLSVSMWLEHAVHGLGKFNLHGRIANCVSVGGYAWKCVVGVTHMAFAASQRVWNPLARAVHVPRGMVVVVVGRLFSRWITAE